LKKKEIYREVCIILLFISFSDMSLKHSKTVVSSASGKVVIKFTLITDPKIKNLYGRQHEHYSTFHYCCFSFTGVMAVTTKVRLLKALVWPVAVYGCESWTLRAGDDKRISAFEM